MLLKLQKEKEKALPIREGEKYISEKERQKSKSSSDKKKDKEDRKEKKRSREDGKKDKKDKDGRKEKEEKRKEKKAKLSAPSESGNQVFVDKLSKADNVLVESKGKLQRTNAVLLERSSVTEEHGQPIDSQNAPCSSDSTGNSGKRKRSLPSPSGIQSNGHIIRIRLSTSQKRDEATTSGSKVQEVRQLPQAREDPVISHKVRPSVSCVRAEKSIKQKDVISNTQGLPCSAATSTATLQRVSADVSHLKEKTVEPIYQKENLSSHDKITSSQKGNLSSRGKITVRESLEKLSSRDKKMQKKELMHKKLFVDWAPPSLDKTLVANEDDDEDWLFGKKSEDRSAKKLSFSDDAQSCEDNLLCPASSVMQPRAHFLPDAGIYALPFTVPF